MFKSAKYKLTGWYLLILMSITVSFSALVYAGVTNAAERALESQRRRFERQMMDLGPNRRPIGMFADIDEQALIDIKTKTLTTLVGINTLILLGAGTLSFFLAEKTLKPIEDMHNKQKRFISDAAHELKTPITALKSEIEVGLRDKNLSLGDAKLLIQSNLEETENLSILVEQLLKQSRYQNVILEDLQNIQIRDFINEIVTKLNSQANQKSIEFDTNIENCQIEANIDQLKEAISNIIENAIKYSKKNQKIEISAKLEKSHLILTIKDFGIGISEENIKYIFDPFYRADNARTKSKENGYGLGLTIAKEIIEKHKGTIEVKSAVNIGTTFIIKLPISQLPL